MEIRIKTKDGKTTTVDTEAESPRLAIKQAMESPLAPENVSEVKTMRRIDIEV